jgi:hypothetical protein
MAAKADIKDFKEVFQRYPTIWAKSSLALFLLPSTGVAKDHLTGLWFVIVYLYSIGL